MKKALLLFAFVTVSLTAFSQIKVRPGVRVGVNQSKITNTTLDSKLGLNAAIFANIQFSDLYALQPEIGYSNQGGTYKNNNNHEENFNLHYVSIAVANKFFPFKDMGLHFIAGPSLDFNFENNWVNLINDNSDSDITPFDLALFAGIGYEFPFGLSIEARYKQGLIDLDTFNDVSHFDNNDPYYYYNEDNENQLNAVFQLAIAYKFNF
ncbi:MAG: PorT family protein [Algicola sp.]|nr:PorT family protein [Algicola sp.]